jgi:DAK2 domain fusion protein YloV
MTTGSPTPQQLIKAAAAALESRKDEVNRLNVFPVPDGDTGTNMALTMDSVVSAASALPEKPSVADVCTAVTQGSLMGARGNSGVILSQIIRGLCEVLLAAPKIDADHLAQAFDRAVTVSFQAVRKPVEGTMLTVLRDTAEAVTRAAADGASLRDVLGVIAAESKASVMRTPDLLPVLAEAGVVDAGGFGLAILAEGFVAALEGHPVADFDVSFGEGALVIETADDWDDEEYLYCTEFILSGQALDRADVEAWVAEAGGSELVVGDENALKIHVHTDDPAGVLARATSLGEIAHVHVNNMRQQTEQRRRALEQEGPRQPLGVVAVSVGPGVARILESLGVDHIVSGGQTMNPSTAELAEAIEAVHATATIVLPNNKNIIMTAEQARDVVQSAVHVVPTTSVMEAFAALLAYDPDGPVQDVAREMEDAAGAVRVGEVTTAVKDSPNSKVGDVATGQIIGITSGEIEVAGDDVLDVSEQLLASIADGAETLTLLAGEDLPDDALQTLVERLESTYPNLEIDALRGDQPLYPVIMGVE